MTGGQNRAAVPPARIGIGVLVGLLAVSVAWGEWIAHHSARSLVLGALPFFGYWELSLPGGVLVAIGISVALVYALPVVAARASWRAVLAAVGVATVVLGGALTLVDPPGSRGRSITTDYGQYKGLVDAAGGPARFLQTYVDGQLALPTHLSAHPPGMPLLLWTAHRVGLSGAGFESGLALVGAAVAAIAALVALRDVAGDAAARAAAPFTVIAPAAIWHTNADTVFAGVAVAAVATVIVATGRTGRAAVRRGALGGVIFGAALLLTYGVAVLVVPMIAIAVRRRAWSALAAAGAATLGALALPALWGFSWLAGLHATRVAYDHSLADARPYWYFLVANLAVCAAAAGPAVMVGLTRVRLRGAVLLVGAGLATVMLADLSGLSSAETERIWQPFLPFLLVAGAAAVTGPRWSARQWLALQAAGTLGLQVVLRSPW